MARKRNFGHTVDMVGCPSLDPPVSEASWAVPFSSESRSRYLGQSAYRYLRIRSTFCSPYARHLHPIPALEWTTHASTKVSTQQSDRFTITCMIPRMFSARVLKLHGILTFGSIILHTLSQPPCNAASCHTYTPALR